METNTNGIAIIGMSGRFPGAENLDQYWQNLLAGVESISFFSDDELAASGLDVAAARKDPGCVAARGFVKDPEWFDAAFFHISDREAEVIDPQQRLFLEATWAALESAGYDPLETKGYVGVYAGKSGSTYYLNNIFPRPELAGMFSNLGIASGDKDYLATRVAYKLNLRGPVMSVQTACSTSMVSVCLASQALLCYQCDMAVAGGVSITFPQKRTYVSDGGMLSTDGHCRPFDAQATGTNFSDGLGVVVLKRLAEALEDGDHIYAVIKGFALNNDGSAKVGFAAPSVDGQAEVIALALAQAGIEPDTISYVETHGTATPLGDPIEIAGLTKAFRAGTSKKGFCAIGSVKGNLGHLDAAAGAASLIKAALALKHRVLPPSINFVAPNPKIDFADSPFMVNAKLTEWEAGTTPRRAGVSNFGVGGTNAHVVLEEAPPVQPSKPARDWQLLLISARTSSALDAATAKLCEHLKANPDLNLADVAWTLQTRRHTFDHRRMLVCRNQADAVDALGEGTPKRLLSEEVKVRNRSIVFMFPGQGAQYVNMGGELYRSERIFKETVDRCAQILAPQLGLDLREVLFPASGTEKAAEELLIQTRITQPALFVIEYALAALWMSWGIKPRAMIGHSVGEYVAACLSGVFTLEEALGIVAGRARLVQAQPGGAMLAVRMPEQELAPLLNGSLSIAAINSPKLSVASGPFEAIAELEAQLKAKGVASRRLQTSHAFHSAMMDPVLEPLAALLRTVQFRKPSIPYLSNVSGTWVTEDEATDPGYWVRHVREAVRFADGAGELLKDPQTFLLEVGPGQTLCSLVSQHSARTANHLVVPSLSSAGEEMPALLAALGKVWLAGAAVDWAGVYKHERRLHVMLPTYPFERKRYWIEPVSRQTASLPAQATEAAASAISAGAAPGLIESPADPAPGTSDESGSPRTDESRKTRILAMLTTEFQALSSADLSKVGPDATFMDMGLDSLYLLQAVQSVEKRFGIRIPFHQLIQDLNTLNELAEYLDRTLPPDISPGAAPESVVQAAAPPLPVAGNPALEAIQAQLEALTRQMELLRQAPAADRGASPVREETPSHEAATPSQDEKSQQQILVQMREGNPAYPAFFGAPGPDATALGMRPLAAALHPDIPFYCIQHKGLDGSTPFASIEEEARACIEEMRKVQPHGPYGLGGFCFGGVLSFEIARRLEQMGEAVYALLLIDSFNPAYIRSQVTGNKMSRLTRYFFRRVGLHARRMRALRPVEFARYVRGRIKAMYVHYRRSVEQAERIKRNRLPANPTAAENAPNAASSFDEILENMRQFGSITLSRYTPLPYDGDAVAFRTADRTHDPYDDHFLGWRSLVRGTLQVLEIDCTHDEMTRDPAVRIIAERINLKFRDAVAASINESLNHISAG